MFYNVTFSSRLMTCILSIYYFYLHLCPTGLLCHIPNSSHQVYSLPTCVSLSASSTPYLHCPYSDSPSFMFRLLCYWCIFSLLHFTGYFNSIVIQFPIVLFVISGTIMISGLGFVTVMLLGIIYCPPKSWPGLTTNY